MKKQVSVVALACLLAAGTAQASGFRIPEQSVDSTAKSGANIASAKRADASYFNPANMSWMEDTWHVQGNFTYIHLFKNEFTGDDPNDSDKANDENFFVPTTFLVSPDYNGFRFGFAMTAPYGLAKRWDNAGATVSEEFSLVNIEANPTVSYKLNDYVSLAAGARLMYAEATLKNALYDMNDDTWEWGYNAALSVRPFADDSWNISATYRSKIDLGFSSDNITFLPAIQFPFDTSGLSGSTSVPAPAVLALSTAFKPAEKWTVELTWDRTFWSKYSELDIQIEESGLSPLPPIPGLPHTYSNSFAKNWDDADAYRIAVSYQYSPKLELMAGFAYDETGAPSDTVSYDLPDANAWLYSAGFQYAVDENLEWGMAVLYDQKEDRKVGDGVHYPKGDMNGSALLVSFGLNYKF